MTELLTAAQMREIETAAIQSGSVTGLELMERAGRGVVDAIFSEWPDLAKSVHTAVVLCGPGNNGGDGFVVARLLKERGWNVAAYLHGDPDMLPADAKTNCDRWRTLGRVRPLADLSDADASADLTIDALFGTGLTRALDGEAANVAQKYQAAKPAGRVVAVDAPSGLCMDSGRPLGPVVPGDLTVSFHASKVGHHLGEGPRVSGRIVVCDIGLSHRDDPNVVRLAQVMSGLSKSEGHKYAHGHALILSGGPGKGGAARLAARGALRIGAGLVTVGCPPDALSEHAAQLTAIMCRAYDDESDLIEHLVDERLNALCLGPGLGIDRAARAKVTAILGADRATVLDADALMGHADKPQSLFDQLHEACVLTPHFGEFSGLFPDIAEKLTGSVETGPAYSKVDAARAAAERAGCVVLLKGPDTVVAAPDGRANVSSANYERAAPWLATAGSGDVLAGFITGLLARGFDPFDAAVSSAWLHVECALSFGPGLIAEDLPEEVPNVLRGLG